jgi:hypothetical protein
LTGDEAGRTCNRHGKFVKVMVVESSVKRPEKENTWKI